MNILKELDELTKAQVITTDTADNIRTYYKPLQGRLNTQKEVIFFLGDSYTHGIGFKRCDDRRGAAAGFGGSNC